jgi:predicted permease
MTTMFARLLQDFRLAGRSLRAAPGFFLAAVATLALGVGAVASIFTVYDAVFLKPLPFKDVDRIVRVLRDQPPVSNSPVSPPVLGEWQEGSAEVFDAFGAYEPRTVSLTGAGEAVRLNAYAVTPGYWQVFGQPIALGRAFGDAEETAGERVLVIGEALWRDRFAGAHDVIGRDLQLNGETWRVIGVAEPGFRYPSDAQLWLPTFLPASTAGRGSNSLAPVARLAHGVGIDQAEAALAGVTAWQAGNFPDNHAGLNARVQQVRDLVGARLRSPMAMLLATAGLVLLIACANLANLMLARGQSRGQELAIRRALGAGAARLVGQVLAESLIIALAAAAAAVLLIPLMVDGLLAMAPELLPGFHVPAIDLRAVAVTGVLAVSTLLLFGLWPARRAASVDPVRAMQGASRSQTGSQAQVRARSLLVSTEIAVAMALLVGAGLMIDSMRRLGEVDSGIADPGSILSARFSLPAPAMQPGEEFPAWFARGKAAVAPRLDHLDARLRALPGVQSIAFSEALPASGQSNLNGDFSIAGRELPEQRLVEFRFVNPDYFDTFGIPLLAGRTFERDDGEQALFPSQALVNQAFVDTYLGGGEAIGVQVSTFDGSDKTIVGVVGDVRQRGLDQPAAAEIYFPIRTVPIGELAVALKTSGDALALADTVRRAINEVAADVPVFAVRTMDAVTAETASLRRFNMSLMTVFAAVAVLLAAIGLYGVIAWSVGQRRSEIGVRQSLGATALDVHRLVLGNGLRMIVPGLVAGALGALALGRLVAAQLYGVGAADPVVLAGAAIVLLAVALAACVVPTLRAARVPPMDALRST